MGTSCGFGSDMGSVWCWEIGDKTVKCELGTGEAISLLVRMKKILVCCSCMHSIVCSRSAVGSPLLPSGLFSHKRAPAKVNKRGSRETTCLVLTESTNASPKPVSDRSTTDVQFVLNTTQISVCQKLQANIIVTARLSNY